jgi:hypothetical protein
MVYSGNSCHQGARHVWRVWLVSAVALRSLKLY